MRKYHVNPATGTPSICRAQVGNCPYGGESGTSNHYDTYSEAQKVSQAFYERMYNILPDSLEVDKEEVDAALESNKKIKKDMLIPKGTQEDIQYGIANSKDPNLVMAVIEGEIYQENIGWEYTSVALQNENISQKFLNDALYNYPDEYDAQTRKWLILNESIPPERLKAIAEDENEDMEVRALAFRNKNMDSMYVESIKRDVRKLDTMPYSMIYSSKFRDSYTNDLQHEAVLMQRRYNGDIIKAIKLSRDFTPWYEIKR